MSREYKVMYDWGARLKKNTHFAIIIEQSLLMECHQCLLPLLTCPQRKLLGCPWNLVTILSKLGCDLLRRRIQHN